MPEDDLGKKVDADAIDQDAYSQASGELQKIHQRAPKHSRSTDRTPPSRKSYFSPSYLFLYSGILGLIGLYVGLQSFENKRAAKEVASLKSAQTAPKLVQKSGSTGNILKEKKTQPKTRRPDSEPQYSEFDTALANALATDPVFAKKWKSYQRRFILAQGMRQQPPRRPKIPGYSEDMPKPVPDHIPYNDDDDYENPYPFGEPLF